MSFSIKTTAVFLRPFELPSFNEILPAGEYEIETGSLEPVDWIKPGTSASSVLVRLHPRASHPGLSRAVTVPLAELERAAARDKLSGKALKDYFLEEMLADPMIRLVMQADGVEEADLRGLYSCHPVHGAVGKGQDPGSGSLPDNRDAKLREGTSRQRGSRE